MIYNPPRGQIISKGFLVSSISSKKRMKTCRIVVKMNSFVWFLEEFTTWQFAFVMNRPLKVSKFQKQIVKPWIHPKNERMNSFLLLCNLFLFVFWKKLKTLKRHFEINWPLKNVESDYLIKFPVIIQLQ